MTFLERQLHEALRCAKAGEVNGMLLVIAGGGGRCAYAYVEGDQATELQAGAAHLQFELHIDGAASFDDPTSNLPARTLRAREPRRG